MSTIVFGKTKALTEAETHYCPGCPHGIIHRLVAEVIEEMGEIHNTIAVAPVGCAVLANNYFNMHGISAAHGRAPAVATGLKRTMPEKMIFTYQGDGDLASIGAGEIVHAAHRGENFTVIYVNNAIYGMTGGQMSPNTLPGQKTSTSPYGRDVLTTGMPLKVSEMLSQIPSVEYIERVSIHDAANIRKAKKAIKKAFENQKSGKGFSMIEVLSTCNIGWGLTPVESLKWLKQNMIPYYPLGVYKDGKGNI